MLRVTLTIKCGDTCILELPVSAAEILKSSVPYFLAYGSAAVQFETSDTALNEQLERRLPDTVDGGILELNLLADILNRMDGERLAMLSDNLPDAPCGCADLIHLASCCNHYPDLNEKSNAHAVEPFPKKQTRKSFKKRNESQDFARLQGDLARFDAICDYVLPDSFENGKLCSYEFGFLPAVNFGGSEGIYVDCYLMGKFDESGRSSLRIGTLKTLDTGLDACKVMGELCGALLYHEYQYVNENLYLFDSTESIERMATRKLNIEQTQDGSEAMQMGQQM